MASIIRSVERAQAVTRLPTDRGHRYGDAKRDVALPEVQAEPALASPVAEHALGHMGAVAAATIVDMEQTLLDKAVEAARAGAAAEITRLREEGEKRGYEEGMQRAQEQGEKLWREKLERLSHIAGDLQEQRARIIDDAEDAIIELVFEATARILGEASATREGILAVTRQILGTVRKQAKVLTIRLAPADLEFLGGSDEILPGVALVADPRVQLGGCLLDLEQGTLDGRLEIQLERLKDAILDVRRSRGK